MDPRTLAALSTVFLSNEKSLGTGYFYLFEFEDGQQLPAIITNKHVIDGSNMLTAHLQIHPKDTEIRNDGSSDGELKFTLNFESVHEQSVRHPDKDIDLCAIPVGGLFFGEAPLLPKGFTLKSTLLNKRWQISREEVRQIRPIERILMVGYPNGLWDGVNNRAITRQGITASHPFLPWNGTRQFVVDVACFPGSSGSPIFRIQEGMVQSSSGFSPGVRLELLGTLWGGPTFSAEGKIIPTTIPTSTAGIPLTQVMMNLGFVVPANALDDLQVALTPLLAPLKS